MKYGISQTQETDKDTVAHIRRPRGAWRRKSLCGKWTTPITSPSDWNLCLTCVRVQVKTGKGKCN